MLALVETRRQTACGGCESRDGCGTSVLAGLFGNKVVRVTVSNAIGANPGDQVIIGLNESDFSKASFTVYLLPLLALMGFAMAGQWLAGFLQFDATEPWSVAGGLLGLVAALLWVRKRDLAACSEQPQAVILRWDVSVPVPYETT